MSISKLGAPPVPAQESPQQDKRHPKVLEAARMYEGQFLREMLRAMKKTVPESEFMPESQAEKIFREQLDNQSVDNWVDRGGVGMADLIYDQLIEKYAGITAGQKPQGPIPFEKVAQMKTLNIKPEETTYRIKPTINSFDVTAPWAGKVVAVQSLDHGLSSLLLDHGVQNGDESGSSLKSSLVYKGSLLIPELTEVKAGQRLGLLNPSNDGVLWRVQTL